MKRIASLALATTLLMLGSHAAEAGPIFRATLSGDQEVPTPVTTDASGTATLSLDDAMTRLEILIELTNLDLGGLQTPDTDDDVVGLHIHRGPVGVNGPVVFGFINPDNDLNADLVIDPVAGTVFGAWDLDEGNATTLAAEIPALLADGLYLNVHTPANPAGEIRGQILRVPEPGSLALLGAALLALGWSRRSW